MPNSRLRTAPSGPFVPEPAVSFPSLAGLALRANPPYPAGALAWIESLRCPFVLDRSATEAPIPGQLIPADNGEGLWRRLTAYGDRVGPWASQAEWYIDALNGDVENDGAAADRALPSWLELMTRLRGQVLRQPTGIHLVTGLDEYLELPCQIEELVTIEGSAGVTVEATDTLSAVTAASAVTNEWWLVEATGIADWTPYVGRRIRITSGPNANVLMWVLKADPDGLGVDVARVSAPYSMPTYGAGAPVPGDPIAIEQVPTFRGFSNPPSRRWLAYPIIEHCGFVYPPHPLLQCDNVFARGCLLDAAQIDGYSFYAAGCLFSGANTYQNLQSAASLNWSAVLGNFTNYGNFQGPVVSHTVVQGGTFFLFDGAFFGHPCGAFDSPAAGIDVYRPGPVRVDQGLMGKGNAIGLRLKQPGSLVSYSTKPIITGTTEINVNGAPTTWAAVPFWNPVDATGIVT